LDLLKSLLVLQVPVWVIGIFVLGFWLVLHSLSRFIRLWSFLTLPATFLHELAHGLVGLLLGAQPTSFSLWPKKVSATSWRLGSVGFSKLCWWNGGAVTLAPLLWFIVLAILLQDIASIAQSFSIQASAIIAVLLVWLSLAILPSSSDWRQALTYWPSAIIFLAIWGYALYWLLRDTTIFNRLTTQ
jgi:Peptidase M50B-like